MVAGTPGRGGARRPISKRPNAAGAITSASIGRWMRDLTLPEKDQVRRLATDRLLELDYVTERDWR